MDNTSDRPEYKRHDDSTQPSYVQALLQNEPEAWEQFASVWGPVLYGYFNRRNVGHEGAKDLVQEVIAKVFKVMNRNQFVRDGKKKKLKHFVFMIARQQLATFIERYASKPASPGGTDFQQQFANLPEAEDSEDFETHAIVVLLDKIEQETNKESWQAFHWSYYDNLSHEEIGKKLGISRDAAKLRIHRIRERIGLELETEIVDEE